MGENDINLLDDSEYPNDMDDAHTDAGNKGSGASGDQAGRPPSPGFARMKRAQPTARPVRGEDMAWTTQIITRRSRSSIHHPFA